MKWWGGSLPRSYFPDLQARENLFLENYDIANFEGSYANSDPDAGGGGQCAPPHPCIMTFASPSYISCYAKLHNLVYFDTVTDHEWEEVIIIFFIS